MKKFFKNDGYFHLINSFIHKRKKYLHLIITLLVPFCSIEYVFCLTAGLHISRT